MNDKLILIDPSHSVFYGNMLFDPVSRFNRDNQFLPGIRFREAALKKGIKIETANLYWNRDFDSQEVDYYSFGLLNYSKLAKKNRNVRLKGFFICEPPVVQPGLYKILPELTKVFEHVYIHNTEGDGYSLRNVDQAKLMKYYWAQPFENVLESCWSNQNRQHKMVVVNGNRAPKDKAGELYSRRIEAMVALSQYNAVDLFGMKWDSWKTRSSIWMPYLKNRSKLLKIYQGSCGSKYDVLSRYVFSLCFENMAMKGYITEKLFDCLYAGTIPLYLGAKDIEHYIPRDVFVDCRQFKRWEELWEFVKGFTPQDIARMREEGKRFLATDDFKKYYHSLENCIDLNS